MVDHGEFDNGVVKSDRWKMLNDSAPYSIAFPAEKAFINVSLTYINSVFATSGWRAHPSYF